MTKYENNINKYLDYLIIGEKVTSYNMPLIVEEIKNYDEKIVMYTKNVQGYCLSFDKDSFLNCIKNYKEKISETKTKT